MNVFYKEKEEFEKKFFPCLLQDILVHRLEIGEKWASSSAPDLFRKTDENKLKINFGITISSNWKSFTGKVIESNNFLSFAMKKGKETYLMDPHFIGRDVGLEVLGSTRRQQNSQKCSARSIQHVNPNPGGEREALFPVGTRFKIITYKDMGEDRLYGEPRHVFRLLEV